MPRAQSPRPGGEIRIPVENAQREAKMYELVERQMRLLDRLLNPKVGIMSDYDWTKVKTKRGEFYHPAAWVQSLDDTPEIFREEQTRKVQLRSEVKKYLHKKNNGKVVKPRTWTLENIEEELPPNELIFFNCFHVKISTNYEGTLAFSLSASFGRVKPEIVFYENEEGEMSGSLFVPGNDVEEGDSSGSNHGNTLWSYWLENRVMDYPYYNKLNPKAKEKLNDEKTRVNVMQHYQSDILATMNDSVSLIVSC
jgi:hypothetical protein